MSPRKILVVDDEEDVREVLRLHLEAAGYNIIEAENGEVAIQKLQEKENRVDVGLILCDIRMPKVNGHECTDFFEREVPEIPVMVITGYPDKQLSEGMFKKGVKEYLVKPVERATLLQKVESLIVQNNHF
jgi:CheY-like chemotaxis protein